MTSRIKLVLFLCCVLAGLSTCAVFGTWNYKTIRDSETHQLELLSNVLAYNAAVPLTTGDVQQVRDVLKSLRFVDSIRLGCVFDANEVLIAHFSHQGYAASESACIEQGSEGALRNPSVAFLEVPVLLKKKKVGRFFVEVSLKAGREQALYSVLSILGWVLLSLAVVYYIGLLGCKGVMDEFIDIVFSSRSCLQGGVTSFPNVNDPQLGIINSALAQLSAQCADARADLKEARLDKEEASRVKSQFLANMSHEIRTPLNGVIATTSLLSSTPLSLEQETYVSTISMSSDALLAVVDDILDISKVEARSIELSEGPVDIVTLGFDVCRVVSEGLETTGVDILADIDYMMEPWVVADGKRLRQILNNLLVNAVKFTETGHALVRVSAENETDKHSTLVISVEDTGVGIDRANFARIFDKFSQVDMSLTRSRGGVGLGLSITRHLVNLMGGAISVDSRVGVGSKFRVRLTLRKANIDVPRFKGFRQLKGQKIALLDSYEPRRRLLAGKLRDYCALECIEYDSVEQFVESCSVSSHPRCMLVAEEMWDEYRPHLQKRLGEVKTPAVFATILLVAPLCRDDLVVEAADGAVAVLSRPVDFRRLVQEIELGLIEGRPSSVDLSEFAPKSKKLFNGHEEYDDEDATSRVLLVEDNPINQKVTSTILRKLGFKVILAEHGQAALNILLEDTDFTLIFMDCQMPVMDGYEATPLIKEIYSTNDNHCPPVIALTAHSLASDREKCMEAGMDDYMTKPFTADAISQMTSKWMTTIKNDSWRV